MEEGDTDSNKNAANIKNQLINHEREKPIPAKRSIHSDSHSGSGDSVGKGSHKTGGGASDQRAGSKPLSPSPRSGGAGSSQLTSVGYISGDKPTNSHVWSKHSSSEDSNHHSNSDSVYYNKGSNFGDSNKIKSNNYHSSITAALDTLKDEILYSTQVNGMNEFHLKTVSELVSGAGNAAIGVTGNVGNQQLVFMEGRNGRFVPTTRSAALKNSCSSVWLEKVSDLDLQTPLDQAILVQKIFTPLAIISSGLLGGVALMQLFMSYSFMKQNCENCDMNDNFTFIESYNTFAKVAPTAFYILLAICVVAIFDRFDLAHLDIRHCSDTLSYRHGWILLIVYLLTLLITLWAAELDDMLLLYPHDKSFAANQQQMISLLSEWHRLNICRCVFAILGWVILALSQPDDLLLCHLKSIKQFDAQPKKNTCCW